MERERMSFESGGAACAGYLYLPDERPGPLPCVVLAHGVSGTMDRLFPQAEAFAAAGLAALVFDYGGFGESGGEPRLVLDVKRQQENLRAALAAVRAHEDIDPDAILLWGNSLGGAHAITVAAGDPRVAAVVAQIPFNGFPRKVAGRSSGSTMKLLAAILWDALRGALRLRPYYIPMLGSPGELAVAATHETERHIRLLAGEGGETRWRNSIAPRGLLGMMRYRPAEDAARLTRPLLVCIAAQDRETPEETARQLAERAPHGELLRYEGTHFTFYTDPAIREKVLADQIAFYRRHLPATAP